MRRRCDPCTALAALLVVLLGAPVSGGGPSSDPPQPPGTRRVVSAEALARRAERIESLRRRLSRGPDSNLNVFTPHRFDEPDGQPMPYRLYTPKDANPGKSYPLIVFFHGLGSVGEDNRRPITGGTLLPAGIWTTPAVQAKHLCFVLAPQCPASDLWVNPGRSFRAKSPRLRPGPTEAMRTALALIDHVIETHPIDRQRLYAVGTSMGGYAVWEVLARRPDQ